METSRKVYEVECNDCLEKYTSEAGRKLKEKIKENKEDRQKNWLSRHMKTAGYFPAWNDVRIIYRQSNWKKRKFEEAAKSKSQNK